MAWSHGRCKAKVENHRHSKISIIACYVGFDLLGQLSRCILLRGLSKLGVAWLGVMEAAKAKVENAWSDLNHCLLCQLGLVFAGLAFYF